LGNLGRLLVVELRELKRQAIMSLFFSIVGPVLIYFLYSNIMKYSGLKTGYSQINTIFVVVSTTVVLFPMLIGIYYWMRYLNKYGIIFSELTNEYKLFELYLTKCFVHIIHSFVNIAIFSFLLLILFKIYLTFNDFVLIALLIFLICTTQYIVGLFFSLIFQKRAGSLTPVIIAYLVIFVLPGLLGTDAEIRGGMGFLGVCPVLYIPFLNLHNLFRSLFLFNEINFCLLWYTVAIDIILIFIGYFWFKKKLLR